MLALTQTPNGNKHHLSVTNPSSEQGIARMQQPQPHGTGFLGGLEATAALIHAVNSPRNGTLRAINLGNIPGLIHLSWFQLSHFNC